MSDKDYFLDGMENQAAGKVGFGWFHRGMEIRGTKNQQDRAFKGNINPSGLEGIDMCPLKFFKDIVEGKKRIWKISFLSEMKKARGTAMHETIQDCLMRTLYYWGPPNYPEFVKELLAQKKHLKPEPEFCCLVPEWNLSGWGDFPAKEGKNLVIVDFKFTNFKGGKDWDEQIKLLPLPKQKLQLYTYGIVAKDQNLFGQAPAGVRLMVYNNYIIPEIDTENDPEFEWYEDWDVKYEQAVRKLLTDLGNRATLWKEGKDCLQPCNYEHCMEHSILDGKS
jgi:hypothetical protein